MPNYFENNTAGLRQGLGNLATAFARQPYFNAMARNRQAQMGLYNARANEQDALTGLNNAKRDDLLRKGALVDALQRYSSQAQSDMIAGHFDTPAVHGFIDASSALTGFNKDDIQENFKKGMSTQLAMMRNLPLAAQVQDPVKVQNNDVNAQERAARPITAPTGSTVFNPDGSIIGQAGYTLNPGQQRYGGIGQLLQKISPSAADVDDPSNNGAPDSRPAVAIAQNPQRQTASGAKREIKQVLNPARVVSGVVDTNQPAFLSLTNTTTPISIPTDVSRPAAEITPNQPPAIPATHVAYLIAHPNAAADFDAKYGAGASAKYLSGQ